MNAYTARWLVEKADETQREIDYLNSELSCLEQELQRELF